MIVYRKDFSLSCTSLLGVCILLFAFNCLAYEVELEPITVSLEPVENGPSPVKHTVFMNPSEDNFLSIDTALDQVTGLDISRRGIFDIQSDASIRGATFEQTSISVNNIMLNDPQTGHHSLDLAFPESMIDGIEIIRGQSAEIWAQNSIGGSININTKRPVSTGYNASVLYGTDDTQKSSIYASMAGPQKGINLAAEESSSDGFRQGTDFRQFSVSSSATINLDDNISNYLFAGYGEKEFGAANFYAPYNSKEWTDTLFLNWQTQIKMQRLKIMPGLYYRKHHDKFMLDIERPDFYLNYHKTGIRGILIDSDIDLDCYGLLKASLDINEQSIKSSRLGTDSRNRYSYSVIWKNYHYPVLGYDMSLRIDGYSAYNTEILPQAGVYFRPAEHIKIRSSVARSSRAPNYTELFYEDPVSKGNTGLRPESAMTYEAGLDLVFGKTATFNLMLTAFRRDSDNLIDWVKNSPSESVYHAQNIKQVITQGLEAEFTADISWLQIKTGYSYINSDVKNAEGYISKYALNYPDHKLFSQADIILPFGRQGVNLIYKNKKDYNSYFIMGCKLNYDFNRHANIFMSVDNIFDVEYWDIKDNLLPGRQFMAGIRIEF
jgi:vitamin B12 transporter